LPLVPPTAGWTLFDLSQETWNVIIGTSASVFGLLLICCCVKLSIRWVTSVQTVPYLGSYDIPQPAVRSATGRTDQPIDPAPSATAPAESEPYNGSALPVVPELKGVEAEAVPLIEDLLRCLSKHRETHVAREVARSRVLRPQLEGVAHTEVAREARIKALALEQAAWHTQHAVLTIRARSDLVTHRLPRIASDDATALNLLSQVIAATPVSALDRMPQAAGLADGFDPLMLSMELRKAELIEWKRPPRRADDLPVLGVPQSSAATRPSASLDRRAAHDTALGSSPFGMPVHGYWPARSPKNTVNALPGPLAGLYGPSLPPPAPTNPTEHDIPTDLRRYHDP